MDAMAKRFRKSMILHGSRDFFTWRMARNKENEKMVLSVQRATMEAYHLKQRGFDK